MPSSVMTMLESWQGALGSHRFKEMWVATPAYLMWCLWKEKNRCTYKGKALTLPNLKFWFLKTLYEWGSKSYTFSAYSMMEFLGSYSPIISRLLAFSPFLFLFLLVVILCFYCILAVYLFSMNWHYLISRLLAFSPFLFLFLLVVILCFYSILPVCLFLMKWYICPPYVRCRYYIGSRIILLLKKWKFQICNWRPFSFFFFFFFN